MAAKKQEGIKSNSSFFHPSGHIPTACPLPVAQPEPQETDLQEEGDSSSHSVLAQGHLFRPFDPLGRIPSLKRVRHSIDVDGRGTLGSGTKSRDSPHPLVSWGPPRLGVVSHFSLRRWGSRCGSFLL